MQSQNKDAKDKIKKIISIILNIKEEYIVNNSNNKVIRPEIFGMYNITRSKYNAICYYNDKMSIFRP